jgi:hypothetical protein
MSNEPSAPDQAQIESLIAAEKAAGRLNEQEVTELLLAIGGSPEELPSELREETEEVKKREGDIRSRIRDMKLPQKMKLAMFGNSVCRSLLIFDANRLIQEAVLKNPQLQVTEVENFVKNSNCPEHVLRNISANKTWMRGYLIKVSFVLNPKSPSDLALKWMIHLRRTELRKIAQSKNLPQIIATTAKKRLSDMAA